MRWPSAVDFGDFTPGLKIARHRVEKCQELSSGYGQLICKGHNKE
jgi:hypothetical protein